MLMKKLIVIVILLFSMVFVNGAEEPRDLQTLNKIQQEHQNTRKFFSDELTRQQNAFFKKMDDRANYYEETAEKMVTTTVWKLALLWGGVMILFVSFSAYLKTRLERRKYDKLKANIKEELTKEMKLGIPPPQPEIKKDLPKEKFIYDNKFEVEL